MSCPSSAQTGPEPVADPVAVSATETATPFAHDDLEQAGRITLTPGFSPDGQTLYFAQTDCRPIWECPQTLKRSHHTQTGWSAPETVPLPVSGRVDYPSVTPDGRTLLISWNANRSVDGQWEETANFDLWSLALNTFDATPERLMGPDVNRVRGGRTATLLFVNNETAPVLTNSGNLYFWSERLDAIGRRDVFRASPAPEGGFAKPVPLPAPINSTGEDDGAWISADEQTMLITYSDRGGCGGSDLFLSRQTPSGWSAPLNLGCEINSPYDEGAGTIIPGGGKIVFMSTRPMADGTSDAYSLWQASFKP